jgi:hypothetical protein
MALRFYPGADSDQPPAPAPDAPPDRDAAKPVVTPVSQRKTGKTRNDKPTGGKER